VFRFISFIKFYLSATNEHGVHSPFVYDYLTKCLYKKEYLKLPIVSRILVKSIIYFKYKSIRLLSSNETIQHLLSANCPEISFTHLNADIIFGSICDFLSEDINMNELQNDTMVLLYGIYVDKISSDNWKKLKNSEHVRVTVDLYYCGLLFFRKEQVKEHFKIRI
jgi:hypothetical protein